MLIKIIEAIDDIKNRVVRLRSFVRLYRYDEVSSGGGNAFYRSALTGALESYTRGADGKLVAVAHDLPIFKHQRAQEMIEAGPKVVDDFSSKNGKSRGNYRRSLCDERILEPIILKLSDNLIRFGLAAQKDTDFRVEIVMFSSARLILA